MRKHEVVESKKIELNISISSHGKLNFYTGVLVTGHL